VVSVSFLFGVMVSVFVYMLTKSKENELKHLEEKRSHSLLLSKAEEESEESLYTLLSDMAYKRKLHSFSFVSNLENKSLYEYKEKDYHFTVSKEKDTLSFNIYKEHVHLFSFDFDFDTEEFTKKFFFRNVLTRQDRSSTKTLNDFMEEVTVFPWEHIKEKNTNSSVATLHQAFFPLESLKKELSPLVEENNVFAAFMDIINHIETHLPDLEPLDLDKKHMLHTMIQKDILTLFQDYRKLDSPSQQKYEQNVRNSLSVLEKKITSFQEEVMSKNIHDLTVTMNVIEKRYEEK